MEDDKGVESRFRWAIRKFEWDRTFVEGPGENVFTLVPCLSSLGKVLGSHGWTRHSNTLRPSQANYRPDHGNEKEQARGASKEENALCGVKRPF